jgi:ABC-2 type transport system ATP-binding protein
MEEAEYCHRLAFMNRGRLIALDTPLRLRQGMDEPILEFTTDDPPRAVELLATEPGVHEASLYGRAVRLVVSDPARARDAISRRLHAHDMRHDEIRTVPPRLEDAFVAHIRREGGAVLG